MSARSVWPVCSRLAGTLQLCPKRACKKQSERSYIPQMPWNPWIRLTGNWTASEAYSQAIQPFSKPYIWLHSKLLKNGHYRSGIGGRSTANWASCTKEDCRRIFIAQNEAGGNPHPLLTRLGTNVIYKTRLEAPLSNFQPHHYHRRSVFTDFVSHTRLWSKTMPKFLRSWHAQTQMLYIK